jgi:hypothetical protein
MKHETQGESSWSLETWVGMSLCWFIDNHEQAKGLRQNNHQLDLHECIERGSHY